MRDIEQEMLPLCAEREIGVIGYSPLGAGFLTGKYSRNGPLPENTRFDIIPAHQEIYFEDEKFRILERLRDSSRKLGISMAHLALAWVINRPGVTSVLFGARTLEQIDQAFEAEAMQTPTLLKELDNL
jgi:aryl-alcohol dehydrogenase-like predicted oxidoreductase